MIYVINKSTVASDATVKKWCAALRIQVKRDFAPAWGLVKPPALRFRRSTLFIPRTSRVWIIAVLDNADQAGALGYHSTDDRGRPYARVFVQTAQEYGVEPSTTFSHEVLETYGDPDVSQWADTGHGYQVPVEVCDAVEGDSYAINGVQVSNFLTPVWFGENSNGPRDFMMKTPGPFELAPGGYTVRQYSSGKVDQVFGERANREYVAAKDHSQLGRSGRRRR